MSSGLVREREEWVSFADAAALVGCSVAVLVRAVEDGLVVQRQVRRALPSLSRASATEFRQLWVAEQARRAQEREARARARRERSGPPADGEVWFDTATTAVILGVTANRVRQWAVADRLPGEFRGGRWWFRRARVEQYAAARAWVLHGLAPRLR